MSQKSTLLVVGHPQLNRSMINKRWLESLSPLSLTQNNVKLHLLEEIVRPDGTFDISQEQRLLSRYQRIILQFPLYWYMPPSILVHWMDTVWSEGWAWGEGGKAMEGVQIDAVVSCGAPEGAFKSTTLQQYLAFVKGSAHFVRAIPGSFCAFYGAGGADALERLEQELSCYRSFVLGQTEGTPF